MSKKRKRRKSKRAKNLVGLKKNAYRAHTKYHVDSIDDGYIKTLSPKEQKWMNKFLREYYGTTFSSSHPLHGRGHTKRRELYREKNKREADVTYRREKAHEDYIGELEKDNYYEINPEDALIDLIDLKKGIGKLADESIDEED